MVFVCQKGCRMKIAKFCKKNHYFLNCGPCWYPVLQALRR